MATSSPTLASEESGKPSPHPQTDIDPLTHLSTLLNSRHSTRAFLPTPVPLTAIHNALSLAQTAPSNSNIQNWRLYLLSGHSLSKLTTALSSAAREGAPVSSHLPSEFAHFRSELGQKVYSEGYGVSRSDPAARIAKSRRNYTFFDAPLGGVICMDKELASYDAVSVGMWLQSFLLALTAQGLGSCVMVSTKGYEEVVKKTVGIPDGLEVLSGLAIGYEDTSERVNSIRSGRADWRDAVVEMSD
ncbi:nitroreductase [Lophiostoma macrostomum CBS 122681]|uniref:Nitroreductase n=1 Tax=Lophiostoma macrostomum CBS 122681 TaxID=1314788 RepID=A0A6A6TE23_9PLEO|nr:nitroreductase [Lophiostoma macrostomum CBS 122681]